MEEKKDSKRNVEMEQRIGKFVRDFSIAVQDEQSVNYNILRKMLRELLASEISKAREEGRREVYEAIVFDKNIPHDVATFVAAHLWKNMRDKAKEELSKLSK